MRRYFIEVNEYRLYKGKPYTAKKLIFIDDITAVTEIKLKDEYFNDDISDITRNKFKDDYCISNKEIALTKIDHKELGSILVTESYGTLVGLIGRYN